VNRSRRYVLKNGSQHREQANGARDRLMASGRAELGHGTRLQRKSDRPSLILLARSLCQVTG
jgi:predicted Zn-dependent protease